jgi:hypothetical protein
LAAQQHARLSLSTSALRPPIVPELCRYATSVPSSPKGISWVHRRVVGKAFPEMALSLEAFGSIGGRRLTTMPPPGSILTWPNYRPGKLQLRDESKCNPPPYRGGNCNLRRPVLPRRGMSPDIAGLAVRTRIPLPAPATQTQSPASGRGPAGTVHHMHTCVAYQRSERRPRLAPPFSRRVSN